MDTFSGFPPQPLTQSVHLTIGAFDGLHRGHQKLIEEMVAAARAESCLAGVLTFDPHPLTVLRPDLQLARLTYDEERAAILAALGLDFLLILPFSQTTAATSAADFMRDLANHVHLRSLWVGPDFALGRGREGNTERLTTLGRELSYRLRIVPPFAWGGEPVRSSRVRALLAESGAVDRAAELLGRPYQLWGQVVHGAHRGVSLGFPTANLDLPSDRLVPADGVYACWAWRPDSAASSGQQGYPAVVNVGVRPTFDNGNPSVEAYLMGFEGDLYGETLGLSFIKRLREERVFAGIPALIAQIQSDTEIASRILADPPDNDASDQGSEWEELAHTADRAIRLNGATQRQLFARAARAMYCLQGADSSQPISLARSIQVAAEDTPSLLVAWLNRLLLAQDVGGELYSRFVIHEISDRGLRAVAYGYHGVPRHAAIKAVTYYDLDVAQTPDGWTATLTFDV